MIGAYVHDGSFSAAMMVWALMIGGRSLGLPFMSAAAAGDPVQGRTIAERWCSSCHAVAVARNAANPAPALGTIAIDPAQSPDWLRAWLTASIPPCPI